MVKALEHVLIINSVNDDDLLSDWFDLVLGGLNFDYHKA